jgi:hypothetical protein
VDSPASFSGASATFLALWVEVEGPVGRIGASGVGEMAAGDVLVLGGFWPATFLLLCTNSCIGQNKLSYGWYGSKKGLSSLLPLWQIDSGRMLRHGVQVTT